MTIVANLVANITTPDGSKAYNRLQALHDYINGTLARDAGGVTTDAGLKWTVTHASAIDGTKFTAPTIGAGGINYSVGDTGVFSAASGTGPGGTYITPAEYIVTAEAAGVVTAVDVYETGIYSVDPTPFPVATLATSGTGTGLTLSGTMVAHEIGTYSLSIQASDGAREVCYVNNGTKALPSDLQIKSGVNPLGSAEPITDSAEPWLSATQFAGDSLVNMAPTWQMDSGTHRQFLWIEFDDAVMTVGKSLNRDRALFCGGDGRHIDTQQYPVQPGNTAVDGNCSLGYIPGIDTVNTFWCPNISTVATAHRVRIGKGQSVGSTTVAWETTLIGPAINTSLSNNLHLYGTDDEYLPSLIPVKRRTGTNPQLGYGHIGTMRHIRAVKSNENCWDTLKSGGQDILVVLINLATGSNNQVPIAVFIPNGVTWHP